MADGGGGGGGSSSGPWWKSFTSSGRKKGKDGGGGGGAGPQPPPAPAPQPAPREPSPARQDCQHPGPGEPPRLERLGDEKLGSSRRNLKISRSGRFKEKRKVRATLLPDGTKPPDDSGFPCAPREERQ